MNKSSTALKFPCAPPIYVSLPPSLWTSDLFTVCIVLSLRECHIVGIIQCAVFSDCLISLSNMHFKFVYVFWKLDLISFYCWTIFHCIDQPQNVFFLIHLSTEGHLGCFQVLEILINSCRKPSGKGFLCGRNFSIDWVKTVRVISYSYNKSVFSFKRSCQTIFQNDCIICLPISNEWEFLLLHILP